MTTCDYLTTEVEPPRMIPIPQSLQKALIREREIMLSMKPGVVVKVPKSIAQLLQDYLADRFEGTANEEDEVSDSEEPEQVDSFAPNNLFRQGICNGLTDCLNRFLYLRLLYRQEIAEYKKVYWKLTKDIRNGGDIESLTEEELLNLNGSVDLTPEYQPIYLLRLFVKLPELLNSVEPLTKVDEHEEDVYSCFADILQYMVEHRNELFKTIVCNNIYLIRSLLPQKQQQTDEEEGEDDVFNNYDEDENENADEEWEKYKDEDEEEDKRSSSSDSSPYSPLPEFSASPARTFHSSSRFSLSVSPSSSHSLSTTYTPAIPSPSTPSISSPPPSPLNTPPHSPEAYTPLFKFLRN